MHSVPLLHWHKCNEYVHVRKSLGHKDVFKIWITWSDGTVYWITDLPADRLTDWWSEWLAYWVISCLTGMCRHLFCIVCSSWHPPQSFYEKVRGAWQLPTYYSLTLQTVFTKHGLWATILSCNNVHLMHNPLMYLLVKWVKSHLNFARKVICPPNLQKMKYLKRIQSKAKQSKALEHKLWFSEASLSKSG